MRDAPDESTLRAVASSRVDIVVDAGFTKPTPLLTFTDKQQLIQVIALHHTILKCKAELDDLKGGLAALGVSAMIEKYPDILRPFFTSQGRKSISAGSDQDLLIITHYYCHIHIMF